MYQLLDASVVGCISCWMYQFAIWMYQLLDASVVGCISCWMYQDVSVAGGRYSPSEAALAVDH